MSDINILKSTIEPIANMLAGKKITVKFHRDFKAPVTEFGGANPVIKLPMLSDETPPEILDAVHGMVDHEVAHAIWSTNPKDLHLRDKLAHSLTNSIEDVRIEREMRNLFKGSAHNLQNMARSIVNPEFLQMLEVQRVKKPQMFRLIASNLCLQASEGVGFYQELVENVEGLKEVYDILTEAYGPRPMNAVRSTLDAAEFAEKIRDLLKIELDDEDEASGSESDDDSEQQEGEESQESSSSNSEGDDGGTSKVKSKGKSKPSKKSKPEDSDDKDKDSEGDSKGKDKPEDKSEDDKSKEDDSKSEEPPKSEEEGEGDKPESGEDKDKPEAGEGDASNADQPATGATTPGNPLRPEDLDELSNMTKKVIESMIAEAHSCDSYSVATTDLDKIEHIAPSKRVDKVTELNNLVNTMTGTIQKNFERAIAARSIVMWTPGHRRGKLFAPALVKLFAGDDRVFRRREEAMSKDVAVSLVVDCSGSMAGDSKAPLAATASYALCEVLTRMGIKNEVIGFTTTSYEPVMRSKDELYSREEAIYMPIFKAFSDKFDMTARLRMVKMFESHWMADNVDGESVMYAAKRLMAQPTKRKIMIVLSDGYPAAYGNMESLCDHLKETVQELSKKISIVGIGIRSQSVKEYYPKYVILDDIKELPTVVVKKLQELLTPK